jgi:hypothetical protein
MYIHIQNKEQNKTRSYRPSCKVKGYMTNGIGEEDVRYAEGDHSL